MDRFILVTKKLSKRFPGVQALKDIDMEIRGGEIHSLVGANGAGKSTFAKIISGVYKDYEGEIFINGEKVVLDTPQKSFQYGISVVYQEVDSALIHYFTVAENLLMSSVTQYGSFVSQKKLVKIASEKLDSLGLKLPFDLNTRVSELSVSQKQLLLIFKSLIHNSRLIIFDEPTSSLGPVEVEQLFEIIHSLKERGIAVLYISHRMPEIFTISDKITVFRDGRKMGTFLKDEVTPDDVIRYMIGKSSQKIEISSKEISKTPILEIQRKSDESQKLVLCKGEVLGLTGLVGAGKTELLKEIYTGSKDLKTVLDGKEVRIRSTTDAVRMGIYFLPEERRKEGLLIKENLIWNMLLPSFGDFANALGFMKDKEAAQVSKRFAEKLRVKFADLRQRVESLSGGNQQKLIIARWLIKNELRGARVILFDEPTVGIDVGAKDEIYNIVRTVAESGIGVIFSSSDIDEVLKVADRIVVMRDNKFIAELERKDFSEEKILSLAAGRHEIVKN